MKCTILADGDFPSHELSLKALREADHLYCCDASILKLEEWLGQGNTIKSKEIYVIGDGDSLGSHFWGKSPIGGLTVHYHNEKEQDFNDLTKAFRFALAHGESDFTFVGATGLREDHTLGNISLMLYYLGITDGHYPIRMITDYGCFTPICKSATFNTFPRQQVSIFSLRPDARFSTEGLQYPVSNQGFSLWWEGTLNAALGDSFSILIPEEEQAGLLVYQTHEPKAI